MRYARFARWLLAFLTIAVLAGCGGGSNSTPPGQGTTPSGTVAVVGTDAPLTGILAFQVNLTGLTASDGRNTVSLINGPQVVEFSRLNGLRTLLDFQSVPAGSYTTFQAALSSPVISFLDVSVSPPKVQTINGTLTQSTVTVQLAQPLVISSGQVLVVLFDFRLSDSVEVDASGQITGRITPRVAFRVLSPDSPDATIDELRGGVLSVNLSAKSFVMQGPRGRQITVVTDDQTQFAPGEGLDQLDTNTIVQVSGSLQRTTLTLKADEVLILSRDRFLLGGLITDVRAATGSATQVDLLVRAEVPDLAGVQVGQINTLSLNGNEKFMIDNLRLPVTALVFNRDSLVRGQSISAGGVLVTTSNPPALDTRRVGLQVQGIEGAWVAGSTDSAAGTFKLTANGLTGLLFGQPVTVFTSSATRFVNLAGLAGLTGTQTIRLRVVGLILKSPAGDPVIVARVVEKF